MTIIPTNIICGCFDCSEFGDIAISPKRTVRKYEIEYYLKDSKYTFCDDKKYLIQKNHIQIAKPKQVRYTYLPFTTLFVKFDATGEIAERLENATEYFHAIHTEKIQKLIQDMILLSYKREENNLTFYGKLLQLIDCVLNDSKMQLSPCDTSYEIVAAAKQYIKSNFSDPITLADISKSVNLSQTYFHNLFSSLAGYSPHEYLIRCRLDNAKKLLWDSENELSDIAIDSGFGSQQYMNKVFKKYTGMTPREYRKSLQKKYLL